MMKIWLIPVSMTLALSSGSLLAEHQEKALTPDLKAGEQKASTICMACHGPKGNSLISMWPKQAGQHASYIEKQLHDFKAGRRENVQMTPMAMPLTEQDIVNVAAYYAEQKQTGGKADPALAEQGERIFRAGIAATGVPACSGCHGPAGMGQEFAKFPRLAGQHADYIKSSLTLFMKGERANDPKGMMRGIASKMTEDEMTAVAQYIQGLGR